MNSGTCLKHDVILLAAKRIDVQGMKSKNWSIEKQFNAKKLLQIQMQTFETFILFK